MAGLHAGSGTGTAGKQAVAAPRSLLGVVVLQRAEGTTAVPTDLSESGEGGALPRACCYWAAGLERSQSGAGAVRRAGGRARVAIATGTPLGRAGPGSTAAVGESRGPGPGPGPGPGEAKQNKVAAPTSRREVSQGRRHSPV